MLIRRSVALVDLSSGTTLVKSRLACLFVFWSTNSLMCLPVWSSKEPMCLEASDVHGFIYWQPPNGGTKEPPPLMNASPHPRELPYLTAAQQFSYEAMVLQQQQANAAWGQDLQPGPSMVDGVVPENNVQDDGPAAWNVHVAQVELVVDDIILGSNSSQFSFVRGESYGMNIRALPFSNLLAFFRTFITKQCPHDNERGCTDWPSALFPQNPELEEDTQFNMAPVDSAPHDNSSLNQARREKRKKSQLMIDPATLRRSTRATKYDGFKAPSLTEGRVTKSKVKPPARYLLLPIRSTPLVQLLWSLPRYHPRQTSPRFFSPLSQFIHPNALAHFE